MKTVVIRQKVKDFNHFKKTFDEAEKIRSAFGLKLLQMYRGVEDPNEVVIDFEVADFEKAKTFATSPELKAVRERAGALGTPDVFISNTV